MNMEIAVMTEKHLGAADELRRLAGWNQRRDYCAMLLGLEPAGCFIAMENGEVIGTVTTITYGQRLAWIGMMLVHPDHRRRGVGTRLMHAALDYLRSRGISCIRLDATPLGKPVYEKLGFVAEWSLTRHQAAVAPGKMASNTRELTESDWDAIGRIDQAFGIPRSGILRRLAAESRAALVCPSEGAIRGFGMLRPGSQSDYLGPVVCPEAANAHSLISGLLQAAGGRSIAWDVPDDNPLANELAKQFGFTPVRPLTRMRLGPATVTSDPLAQLAIADPSLG